jgi:luciferase family oxidoreductase group 1
MKVSILDQSPILSGKTAREALNASKELAKAGEKLGYSRYWIAEHHDLGGLACPAPEVMLSYIGSHTNKIRLGAGAVLLPHYRPYRVAETYNMLSALYPGRIDIGIGRAPGGSAEASMALSENFLDKVRKIPASVKELLHFLKRDFPSGHMYSKISAAPVPEIMPEPWILGTSKKSAVLAAENGTSYAFGHFMSDKDGPEIVKAYKEMFKESHPDQIPRMIVAVSVICAETTEQAERLALPGILWRVNSSKGEGQKGIPSLEEAVSYFSFEDRKKALVSAKTKMIIGNPEEVKQSLLILKDNYEADELMIITITHSYEARLRSYELVAKEFLLNG